MASVKIRIDYYDQEQKGLIQNNFPKDFDVIEKIAGKTISIPLEDFKTYAFFRHKHSLNGKESSFIDLKEMAQNWGHYDLYLELDERGALINKFPGEIIEANDVSEMIGIAGGLSVASTLYGFTQADWTKIPISKHKDFDFNRISSLEERFINIETKGSIIPDNSKKSSSVSNHKNSIIGKKLDPKFINRRPISNNTNIGIITVADRNHNLQAWLVDPPIRSFDISPKKTRLLKRLYFYHSIIRYITERSHLTIALADRIKAIENTNDYMHLNKVPLVNGGFNKIELSESFVNFKAYNLEKEILGNTYSYDSHIFFLGISKDIVDIIISQDFNRILEIKTVPFTQSLILDCKKSKNEWRKSDMKDSLNITLSSNLKDTQYIHFKMKTDILQSTSGLCIGRQKL
ncbi:hypothetical protein [Parabacteroides sp. FAFU027]|uniref:hypothetical protein n=1 Tax=Parabacteroides sp. FAFU027 TaxID=2922715 RepID=UPI001FAEBBF8|nr:hypothetical protein [Parabacteroides sp. FAFU027]